MEVTRFWLAAGMCGGARVQTASMCMGWMDMDVCVWVIGDRER